MVNKTYLSINQLISSDLFLGYHVSSWNTRVNYFLLGVYKNSNIFNLNYTYNITKKFIGIISDLLLKKSSIWLVHENFSLFDKSSKLIKASISFPELNFFSGKWTKGILSNYKHIRLIKSERFPHAIFFPNMQNNHYAVNECFLINIPSFALIDSLDNPINVFFPVPGNSRSIKSLFYFYTVIIKTTFFSRYSASSGFLWNAFYKSKGIFSRIGKLLKLRKILMKNTNLLIYEGYMGGFCKNFLLKDVIFLLHSKQFSFSLYSFLNRRSGLHAVLNWRFLFTIAVSYFVNLLRLVFSNIFLKIRYYGYSYFSVFKTLVKLTIV